MSPPPTHPRFQRAGRPRKSGEEDSKQLQVLFGVKGEESESEDSTMANFNAMPSDEHHAYKQGEKFGSDSIFIFLLLGYGFHRHIVVKI